MWVVAPPRRSGTPAPMPSRSGTRSSSRTSRVRTGAGAMSTKPSSEETNTPTQEVAAMPVMGFTKFERFFRAAGGVDVDRDDIKRYLDFVNDVLYDLLLIGQATAKANVRDVILPRDLPVTKGLQESVHAFERLGGGEELRATP